MCYRVTPSISVHASSTQAGGDASQVRQGRPDGAPGAAERVATTSVTGCEDPPESGGRRVGVLGEKTGFSERWFAATGWRAILLCRVDALLAVEPA